MKNFRLLFLSLVILLPGFTCIKTAGVQLNTYTLSECPAAGYTLPNFSETEDLIFTKDNYMNLSCEGYKGYSIMNKEKVNPEDVDFMLKFENQKTKCTVTVLTERFCSPGEPDCLLDAKPEKIYRYNVEQLIPQFLFRNQKISATETNARIVTGQDYTNLCKSL